MAKSEQLNFRFPPAIAEDFNAEMEELERIKIQVRPRDLAAAAILVYLSVPRSVRIKAIGQVVTYAVDKEWALQTISSAINFALEEEAAVLSDEGIAQGTGKKNEGKKSTKKGKGVA